MIPIDENADDAQPTGWNRRAWLNRELRLVGGPPPERAAQPPDENGTVAFR